MFNKWVIGCVLAISLGILIQWGWLILTRKFQFNQSIYDLSPETHQKKKGTPSMGGLAILVNAILGCMWMGNVPKEIFWGLIGWTLFAIIGFVDDSLSIFRKTNKGLSAREKFGLQWIFAVGFVVAFSFGCRMLTGLEMAIMAFFLVGMSNATNLTDGLDGLLGGLTVISLGGLAILLSQFGRGDLVPHIGVIIAAFLIFLRFNLNPAKVFMGDTGSLGVGALLVCLCAAVDKIQWVIPLGAVYILETLSVMIQVSVFKLTKGKRVFLMSPLHHHFELLGLKEAFVVRIFWWLGIAMSMIGIVF